MDGDRFDDLTRSFASRRRLLRLVGAGGLLGAAGRALPAEAASSTTCSLTIAGLLSSGPTAGGSVDGALNLTISSDGTIDQASFVTDGQTMTAVGRAVGRELQLLIDLGDGTTLVLTGVGQKNIAACQGTIAGLVGGPKPGDVGSWTATPAAAAGGNGANGANGTAAGNASGNASGGAATGGAPGAPGQATGGSGTDNGCPGVTCPTGQALDVATCTCVAAGSQNGGDAGAACPGTTNCGTAANPICADTLTDPNFCGGCEVKCAAGQECSAGACVTPCPAGQKRCNGVCADPKDPICCTNGVSCNGVCCQSAQAVCNVEFGDCCESGKLCGGGTVCCQSADDTCCDVTFPRGGSRSACCAPGTSCTADGICCASGVSCSGTCCQSAQAVCNAEFGDCCESGKLCGGGTVCCASADGACCDVTSPGGGSSSACCVGGTTCNQTTGVCA